MKPVKNTFTKNGLHKEYGSISEKLSNSNGVTPQAEYSNVLDKFKFGNKFDFGTIMEQILNSPDPKNLFECKHKIIKTDFVIYFQVGNNIKSFNTLADFIEEYKFYFPNQYRVLLEVKQIFEFFKKSSQYKLEIKLIHGTLVFERVAPRE